MTAVKQAVKIMMMIQSFLSSHCCVTSCIAKWRIEDVDFRILSSHHLLATEFLFSPLFAFLFGCSGKLTWEKEIDFENLVVNCVLCFAAPFPSKIHILPYDCTSFCPQRDSPTLFLGCVLLPLACRLCTCYVPMHPLVPTSAFFRHHLFFVPSPSLIPSDLTSNTHWETKQVNAVFLVNIIRILLVKIKDTVSGEMRQVHWFFWPDIAI